jgi:2-polyprenyl-3-methyl-5-hydroxy-6-metoxy-1,4-benzoquinol methylase
LKLRYLKGCPVGCDSGLETTQYVLPEGALLRCSACGQLISQCTSTDYWQSMQEFDDPKGTLPVTGSEQRSFRRGKGFLKQISKLLNQSPGQVRLLDVGCSSGAFLNTAVNLGFLAEGIEPAPKAAAAALASGLNVRQGFLQEAGYADGKFDAVTLIEVIEHLSQPLELLEEIHRILRPGGVLLIGTGNAASWSMAAMGSRWEYLSISKHGGHISFFSPESIASLAQRSGFSVVAVRTRRVSFYEKGDCGMPLYHVAKLAGDLLNAVAGLLNKGHDMAVYLRKI